MSRIVLIVDDDVNARIIAETLLKTRGLRVRTAGDGKEACDIIEDGDVALVVMELALPGMNGWEVIRRLRGRYEAIRLAAQPRILITSTRGEPETESFALKLGADAFLRKPLEPKTFVKTVDRLLSATPAEAIKKAESPRASSEARLIS
jgi:DNA-binding response OmpR family regulator